MKNKAILLVLTMLGFIGHAQLGGKNYNQFSVEGAYNISVPFAASVVSFPNGTGTYTSYDGFNLGVRYMFNQEWGVKGEMAYNGYHGGNNLGTNFFRLDAQAYYNLGQLINLPYSTNDNLGLLAHSGFGASQSKSLYNNSIEHVGNYLLGATLLYKLSDQFALTGDMTYIVNFKQHNHFDGVPFNPATVKYETGQSINFSIGAVFYLGEKRKHADWY